MVPPDHLVGLVPEDPLRARVPAEHEARGIHGHERLVEDTVHQSAKAHFTAAESLF